MVTFYVNVLWNECHGYDIEYIRNEIGNDGCCAIKVSREVGTLSQVKI